MNSNKIGYPMKYHTILVLNIIISALFYFSSISYSQDTSNSIVIEQTDSLGPMLIADPDSIKALHIVIAPPESIPESILRQTALVNREIAPKKLTPRMKYALGIKLTKAGFITGIIASAINFAIFTYAFSNFDPYGQLIIPTVALITVSFVSVQLTTSGFIIKGINKRKIKLTIPNKEKRKSTVNSNGNDGN